MEIIQETLPNGLTVIVLPMRGAKTITEIFVARAGWKYEVEKNMQGLSHFLEHLVFKGTRKRPTALDITKEVDSRGGIINASTSEEYTEYFVKLSPRFLDVAHDLISDILLNSKFEQEEIKLEKGTVVEEIRMMNSTPSSFVAGMLWPKILYGEQPAGKSGLGTEETVSRFTRERLVDYLGKLYVGPNAAVCVGGKVVSPRRVIKDLKKYFDGISSSLPAFTKPPVREYQAWPQVLIHEKDIDQTHICLGVRAYNINHPDRFALRILQTILGGTMSSRMFTEVRERRGLAYYISTLVDLQTDVGSLITHAGLKQEKIIEGLKVIMDQYRNIAQAGVSEEELRLVKNCIRGRMELQAESSLSVVRGAAIQFSLTGEIISDEEKLRRVEAVTAADIQRVAADIFRDANLNLAVVGPHKKDEEKFLKLLRF